MSRIAGKGCKSRGGEQGLRVGDLEIQRRRLQQVQDCGGVEKRW